ncbi:hypothetical protein KB20921_13060 [Edwardsiella ictaluri]|nr:hypothetical protein KH20906_12770 [Edwardsiella ictaluri]BEI02045.1 hypothetical protein KB20921_13060 [Edwardsiella ictaluri]BEI05514.1 hypothetical protein KH201010_13000 [Edwardsiella ictaluri]BEI08974.1 hypothetical protein STU22726_13050 [Edwardsiella ictaluri]BEI12451.1 hypothetical protein STU22816_13040 [Edwardsiella ictaluri]
MLSIADDASNHKNIFIETYAIRLSVRVAAGTESTPSALLPVLRDSPPGKSAALLTGELLQPMGYLLTINVNGPRRVDMG